MDLEHFVTAQDSRRHVSPRRPSGDAELRASATAAGSERDVRAARDTRSMINLDGALESMAYTEHCLPNDQHRRTGRQDPDSQGVRIAPGRRRRKRSAETFSAMPSKSHSLGIAADAPNGRRAAHPPIGMMPAQLCLTTA